MKTPEEILSRYTDVKSENHFVIHTDHVGDCITISRAAFLIEQAQKEAWNEALDWVLENGEVDSEIQWYDPYDYSKGVDGAVGFINEESILKGKK